MKGARHSPTSNVVLASLPTEEYRRILPDLEFVELVAGEIVHKPAHPQGHVVFPISGISSLNYHMEDGTSVAVALVGREGMLGISSFMDGALPTTQATAQGTGQAFKLSTAVVRRELRIGARLQSLGLRFIQALITQMAQTAVCNRYHTLDQQICRWMLLSLDRTAGNELSMTQESIAQMLGVRREGITAAAGKLQGSGFIRYSRGRISVMDRGALEACVCECYAVVRDEYRRLLPEPPDPRRNLQVIHDP